MPSPFAEHLAQVAAKTVEAATATAVTKALAEPAPAATLPAGSGASPEERAVVKGLFGGSPSLPARTPYGTTGQVGKDSQGYSMLRAAAFALGMLSEEQAKEEVQTHRVLKSIYANTQFHNQGRAFLVPTSTDFIPTGYADAPMQDDPNKVRAVDEIRQKMAATFTKAGWEEATHTKALGTVDDAAGGALRALPQLGEIIEMQRNAEIFTRAGAREMMLPPNGSISFPRQKGAATAYNVGEAAAITESNLTTSNLLLQAKKIGILTKVNAELFRFANPMAEALIRSDMAEVAARKMDLDMLYGTGGTVMKGLRTYPTQSAWTEGSSDKVILYVSTGVATHGDVFQPEDVERMISLLPDGIDPTAFVMQRRFLATIANRRADSVTAADGKGLFMFDVTRTSSEGSGRKASLAGIKVVDSKTVTSAIVKGSSGAVLTEVIAGDFREWIIGRAGVMEFLATNQGDTAFVNDQVWLRGIQHVDAGPRNPASFVVCSDLLF